MSRILPIKKSLDDRFINETDVITEQALAQVIEGQGGGGVASSGVYFNYATVQAMVDYYNEYEQSGYDSSLYKTKLEMAALMNITEEQLEQLVRGQIKYVEFDYETYGSIFCRLIPLYEYRVGYANGGGDEYYTVKYTRENTPDGNTLAIGETSDGMFRIDYLSLTKATTVWN